MAGTLLEDLKAGLSFDEVQRRFREKMGPECYQRPQAPPSAGNIERAEKIVEKLGIKASLRRRFARLEEIQTIWKPTPTATSENKSQGTDGVFAHLKTKQDESARPSVRLPAQTLTWAKFRREVLPGALGIEMVVQRGLQNFAGMLTAADPEAPPVLQWDSLGRRNPVSLYVHVGGSLPAQWGLVPGPRRVTGVAFAPWMWADEAAFAQHGRGVVFILEGAKDAGRTELCLFPEALRSELHEIRSTIEAFSKSGETEGREEASACGVCFTGKLQLGIQLRVKTSLGILEYVVDRWE